MGDLLCPPYMIILFAPFRQAHIGKKGRFSLWKTVPFIFRPVRRMSADLEDIERGVGIAECPAARYDLQSRRRRRYGDHGRQRLRRSFVGRRKNMLRRGARYLRAVQCENQKIGLRQRGVRLRESRSVIGGIIGAGLRDLNFGGVIRVRDLRSRLSSRSVKYDRVSGIYDLRWRRIGRQGLQGR